MVGSSGSIQAPPFGYGWEDVFNTQRSQVLV